jgi:hypothetical protein
MSGQFDWLPRNRHLLRRPLKRAAIMGLLALVGVFAYTFYTTHQISSTVDPIHQSLKGLSAQSEEHSRRGVLDSSWSTTYRFPEERMNRESYSLIREVLQKDGWDLTEELTTILPKNIIGGYLIRAEKSGYTYLAHLPKSGAVLRIEVAESGKPQVSVPTEKMEIKGR